LSPTLGSSHDACLRDKVKLERARGGCLGIGRRRRTWTAAKSSGESLTDCDPEISESGNRAAMSRQLRAEYIGAQWPTRGTETSKYPEEEKSIEIPLVVASERGTA
jgi:hypothetical protein